MTWSCLLYRSPCCGGYRSAEYSRLVDIVRIKRLRTVRFVVSCRQILLLLKDVDALYEGGGIEARKSLVIFLDELCCINGNIKLLLTCEKQLLENANAHFRSTKEQVRTMCIAVGRIIQFLPHVQEYGNL